MLIARSPFFQGEALHTPCFQSCLMLGSLTLALLASRLCTMCTLLHTLVCLALFMLLMILLVMLMMLLLVCPMTGALNGHYVTLQ